MRRLQLLLICICFSSITKTFAQESKEFFTAMQLGYVSSDFNTYKITGINISFDKTFKSYEFGFIMNTYSKENILNEYNLSNPNLNFYMMDIGLKAHKLILRSKSKKSSIFLGLVNGLSTSFIYKDGYNYFWTPKYDKVLLTNSFNYFLSPSVNIEYTLIKNKLAAYTNTQFKFLFGNTTFSNNSDFNKLSMSIGAKLLL